MLTMYVNAFAFFATSATRSVPLWCLGDVSATSAPQSKAASAMRMSSVAMTTKSRFLAFRHRSQTRRTSGLPAMKCSSFPGNRVEFQRAGMIPMALLVGMIENDPRSFDEVGCYPICDGVGRFALKSSLNTDRPHAGIATAFSVDLFIADKK